MKTKNVILFMFIFIMSMGQMDAQFAEYYRTTLLSKQNIIVKTDSNLIATIEGNTNNWYFFEEGLCTSAYTRSTNDSGTYLTKLLNNNKKIGKSDKGNWWYFYREAADGNIYHCTIEIWYDDADNAYLLFMLNKKVR